MEDAIAAYIDGIRYGGVFNKTKLVDAIQAVDGVVDVILGDVKHAAHGQSLVTLEGQNAESVGGLFNCVSTISYLVQNDD